MRGDYTVWLVLGLILGIDWLRRAVAGAVGMQTLTDVTLTEWDRLPSQHGNQPSITVVVPARNEEAAIEACLRSLLAQDYPELNICAVDDRSTDRTGAIMDRLRDESPEKLAVLHVTDLPAGWMGKTHAMWRGAETSSSNWILFTDGDIFFRPDALRRTLVFAESTGCDHLVTFPTPILETFGERMMIAFFAMTGSMLFRPWKIKDPKARDFVGFGAFNLIRRSAYDVVGTYQALRMEVIDDLMLGEAVKKGGLKQDCVVGPELVKLHWAEGAFGIIDNLRKNLFSLLRFSWLLLLLTSIAATAYHLGPWIGLILAPGLAKVGFVAAIAGIALIYFGISQRFQLSAWYFFTQPLGGALLVYAMAASALSSLIHGGVHWRGTTYSIAEIQAAKAKGSPAEDGGKLEARGNRTGN